MYDRKMRNEKRRCRKAIKEILDFEREFAAFEYSGKGKEGIKTLNGKPVIALAAANAVNQTAPEKRPAEKLSGGMALALAKEAGCHAVCVCSQFRENPQNAPAGEMGRYLKEHDIKAVIDLHIVDSEDEAVIFLERKESKKSKFSFIKRALEFSVEYQYGRAGILNSVGFVDETENSITSAAARKSNAEYIYLGLNGKYVQPEAKETLFFLFTSLVETLTMLVNLDWSAQVINVFRLWQSKAHKPQDKIEILFPDGKREFPEYGILNICTYGSELEKVRLYTPDKKTLASMEEEPPVKQRKNEYVSLTNRLIEILFGREWIEGEENEPGLKGAPVIVYSNKEDVYPIGLPKANQIDGVYFSSALFEEKQTESKSFDYVVFNRYTDSRLHIKYDKVNYKDYGRVKTEDGVPAKKIMMPRYYKRLLGYLDRPLKMIRKEEYEGIMKKLEGEEKEKKTEEERKKALEERQAFEACYELINEEVFYRIKGKYVDHNGEEPELSDEDRKTRKSVIEIQNRLGLFNNVELLRIPKEANHQMGRMERLRQRTNVFVLSVLKKTIGKSEYLLKAEWTSETDDRNNIARLSSNMMSLLGVSENDKILVMFGRKKVILRVLANDELTDYQIGVPATARKELGMNSINDIVIVHRDMIHIFWRHSEEQTIALLGTVLAVFQVIDKIWLGILLCLILAPLIMYFVLNEERVKVQ